ncbi:MAG: nucleotidyltransferase domain-containing protein [Chloroflexi bacterium]|nr:nucleotidyltransferase domain-containing protein [Chloroflexota bacterium]
MATPVGINGLGRTGRKVLTREEITAAVVAALRGSIAQKAVLFGSYARGDADEYSDIDLIIVADTPRKFVTRFEDFWPLLNAFPKAMDLLVYTPAELAELLAQDRAFVTDALAEGIVLYEAG